MRLAPGGVGRHFDSWQTIAEASECSTKLLSGRVTDELVEVAGEGEVEAVEIIG